MATHLAVSAELARECVSTAWVQSIVAITTWGAARSPAGFDLFTSPISERRPRMCGVLTPGGTAQSTDGGYWVTGRWPFASGSFATDWFTGGALATDTAGNVSARRPDRAGGERRGGGAW